MQFVVEVENMLCPSAISTLFHIIVHKPRPAESVCPTLDPEEGLFVRLAKGREMSSWNLLAQDAGSCVKFCSLATISIREKRKKGVLR